MRSLLRNPRFLLGLLLLAVVFIALATVPVESLLRAVQDWAETSGPWALLLVTGALVVGILLLLPSSLMMMLAGFLFGPLWGLAVIWVAGLIASTVAFRIGRGLARPWIERRVRGKSVFVAIDRAIERKGFLVVLLTRLVMLLPYQVLNYTLGLTGVGFRAYLLGTNLGMLPPMFLFVYLGSSAADLAAVLDGRVSLDRSEVVVALAGFAAVIGVVALIIRSASRVLREELQAASKSPPGS
jgi:uncharacterized membrane protein YdjX (TVP38/TMEM64 family)